MAACKSCGAPCRWAKSRRTGSFMLLDQDPIPGGNINLLDGRDYADGIARAVVVSPGSPVEDDSAVQLGLEDEDDGPLRYVDHHVTCPFAERWRHGKSGVGRS